MNSISKDLEFTMELCEDFEDQKLPTLSFSLYLGEDGIEHTYFEKTMKNQTLLMERSSLGRQQKMSIMTNELRRRLETLDDNLSQNETISVMDHYIQQLVNSEFGWRQIREIICSALVGHVRREKKRKLLNKPRFRSGADSLRARVERKLVERYNWFRKKRKPEEYENEKDTEKEKREYKQEKREKSEIGRDEDQPKSILFVQNTKDSILAKEIRKVIQDLKPWTRLNIKVVERAGDRIEDLLHKSNPWEERDCGREGCLSCETARKEENVKHKNCTVRSILYKTWCKTCRRQNESKIKGENSSLTNKRKLEELVEKEDYVYIGETSRSVNERGSEHLKDLEFLRDRSHMLKHAVKNTLRFTLLRLNLEWKLSVGIKLPLKGSCQRQLKFGKG